MDVCVLRKRWEVIQQQSNNNIYFWTGESKCNFRRSSINAEWQEQPIDGCLFTRIYRCVPQTADIEILLLNKALLGYLFCWFNSETYFELRAESVSSPLPNLAQLALGSGQRLQSDEVITYRHTVGIHLLQKNTQGGQEEEHTDTHRG